MKLGDTVLVVPSKTLDEMCLSDLAGKFGKIVEIRCNKKQILGCWLEFSDSYLGETEWYIPSESLST